LIMELMKNEIVNIHGRIYRGGQKIPDFPKKTKTIKDESEGKNAASK